MRIAISGASGLVGRALTADLASTGVEIVRLVRGRGAGAGEAAWDPLATSVDLQALQGVDAIVHLAGANVGDRWTAAARRRILESRVQGTRAIAEAAVRLEPRPASLVCASGAGYYGDRGDELLDERAGKGHGFLTDVVAAWEQAARPAAEAGVRVVHLRKGLVLSTEGGALASLLRPFRLGLGGPIGGGRQWWPWVTMGDTVAAYRFALEHEIEGPVNVAGASTRNADFVRAIGSALHRPAVIPLPAPVVRVAFGQMGQEMLLGGQRLVTRALDEAGFAFADRELATALERVLR